MSLVLVPPLTPVSPWCVIAPESDLWEDGDPQMNVLVVKGSELDCRSLIASFN